jgi:hypothetical protein
MKKMQGAKQAIFTIERYSLSNDIHYRVEHGKGSKEIDQDQQWTKEQRLIKIRKIDGDQVLTKDQNQRLTKIKDD